MNDFRGGYMNLDTTSTQILFSFVSSFVFLIVILLVVAFLLDIQEFIKRGN